MNLSILALRVSELVKQFPLIHKALRRVYCVFRPGIRFRMEKAFRSKTDIFVLKIGANDGVKEIQLATIYSAILDIVAYS
jgi:hypothetical protein